MKPSENRASKLLNEIAQKIGGRDLSYCLKCTTCNTCCPVRAIRKTFNPKQLVSEMLSGRGGTGNYREMVYRCLLCGFCQEACPIGLKVNDLMQAIRDKLVDEGTGPLPQHKFVVRDQEWSTSDSVTLMQPDPATGICKRVFFPGCGLSGYSPELVTAVYDYLREKLPGTGIVLGCCGGPTHFLGDQGRFAEILGGVETRIKGLGASELILACPDCYHTIKHSGVPIRVRAITEIILEHGLPKGVRAKRGTTFSLHDSCKARNEKVWQESARSLLKAMGYEVEEMAHSREYTACCGMGGMVPYADPELAEQLIQRRAEEASFDILTYCAACRETLASCKPAIHILDLIFSSDWDRIKGEPPKTGKVRRENQARLKAMLQQMISSKEQLIG